MPETTVRIAVTYEELTRLKAGLESAGLLTKPPGDAQVQAALAHDILCDLDDLVFELMARDPLRGVATFALHAQTAEQFHTLLVLRDVGVERGRQELLREAGRFKATCATIGPDGMEDVERLAVLLEEVGEAARAVLEKRRLANDAHGKDLRAELVQVAAVAVAWVEALDAEVGHVR